MLLTTIGHIVSRAHFKHKTSPSPRLSHREWGTECPATVAMQDSTIRQISRWRLSSKHPMQLDMLTRPAQLQCLLPATTMQMYLIARPRAEGLLELFTIIGSTMTVRYHPIFSDSVHELIGCVQTPTQVGRWFATHPLSSCWVSSP